MEPNPKSFPILSYVMSRINSLSLRPTASVADADADVPDLENPQSQPPKPHHIELVERLPNLVHPELLASMARAISDVSESRSILKSLGPRPDHETLDAARACLAQIDDELNFKLQQLLSADRGDDAERRRELTEAAEKERAACEAIIELDGMHEEYEKLLDDAERRLEKIYDASAGVTEDGGDGGEIQMNEEVAAILERGKIVSRVDLSDRGLRILPDAFGRMRALVSIDLSNNQLEAIPDAIGGLEILEELHLSSNLLVSLPDTIGLLMNLKILDISANRLKSLPDSISKCRSLVELNASYNVLTYLPTNIGYELLNLEKLYVHLNKLRSLPSSVGEMRSLRILDAHFNELRGVPYSIGKLVNLEYLNLSSNFSDMSELPSSIGDLLNLKELDLSNNQIHTLPDTFGRLDNLAKLNLDQNPLEMPPPEIVEEGVEAVKEYMAKRLVDLLLEEELKSSLGESPQAKTGWPTRSTSWLGSWVSDVSVSVSEYLGTGSKSFKDPCLDQQY